MVNPNAEHELHGGCDVLEQPHGREPDAPSAEREEQQRDRGDHPRAQYEDVGRGIDSAEGASARVVLPEKKCHGERGEEEGFNGETDEGAERRFFAQEAVSSPAGGKGEGDPRRAAELRDHHADTEGGERDGDPLEAAQLLMQEPASEGDVEERHEKVAEAALDHVAGVDAPNVDQPIGGEQGRAEDVQGRRLRRAERGANETERALGQDHTED